LIISSFFQHSDTCEPVLRQSAHVLGWIEAIAQKQGEDESLRIVTALQSIPGTIRLMSSKYTAINFNILLRWSIYCNLSKTIDLSTYRLEHKNTNNLNKYDDNTKILITSKNNWTLPPNCRGSRTSGTLLLHVYQSTVIWYNHVIKCTRQKPLLWYYYHRAVLCYYYLGPAGARNPQQILCPQ